MSKFKDQIGFIKWLMNGAASHLANRKELCWAVEKVNFLKVKWGQKKKIMSKECIVSGTVTLLRGLEGAYSGGGAGEITSPVLTR